MGEGHLEPEAFAPPEFIQVPQRVDLGWSLRLSLRLTLFRLTFQFVRAHVLVY